MRHVMHRLVLSALVAGTLTAACDQPESVVPTGPSGATANSIEIVGPSTIAPDTPTQYSANIRLSDGRTKTASATNNITWQSSNFSVLRVNSGLVTPVAPQGEAFITAIVRVGNQNRQSQREVVILPPGTFRVVGSVREVSTSFIPVVGARVEVESGSPFAITDSNGNYRLYGVPASATLRITAPSYATQEIPVQLTNNTTRNIQMNFNGQRASLAGNYTLSISALGSCGTMPAEFRSRQYDAVITQNDATLNLTLTSTTFRVSSAGRGNKFTGTVTSNGAIFDLGWPDWYYFYFYYYYLFYTPNGYPSLVEVVSNTRYLVTRGQFNTTGSAAGLVGSAASGTMTLWDANFPGTRQRLLSQCGSPTQIRLDPR